MPRTLPKPLAAAIGALPTALAEARRLPAKAAALPLQAVTVAFTQWEAGQRHYAELATRGEQVVARMRGGRPGSSADPGSSSGATAGIPSGSKPAPVTPALDAKSASARSGSVKDPATRTGSGVPSGTDSDPTPMTRHDTAASAAVVQAVEEVAEARHVERVVDHADLPLPDYDHMTLGSLRGRLRSLSLDQLLALRDYEKSRGHRLPVITLLDNRIARLASGDVEAPAGAVSPAPAPEQRVTPPAPPSVALNSRPPFTATPRTKTRVT